MTDAFPPSSPTHSGFTRTPPAPPAQPAPPAPPTDGGTEGTGLADTAKHAAGTAKEQASNLGGSAADSAKNVAGAARSEAGNVAGEAKQQAKALYAEATTQLRDQAGEQQTRAAKGLHTIGDELSTMADSSEQQGLASELVSQIASRASGVASWLESREPADVLDEVKRYARRKPGTFIALCAVAGLVAGRLVRNLASEAKDEKEATANEASTGTPAAAPSAAAAPPATATPFPATSGYEATGTNPAHAAPATIVDAPPIPAPGQGSGYDDGSRR